MWTIRFAKSRMRKSRTSGVLWGVYDRKGCTYSTSKMHVRILWGAYDRKGCVYSTSKITATGYDVVLGTGFKKENGETRPYQYGNHKKLNLKEGTVTATFKNVPKGTWVVGMHAFNRSCHGLRNSQKHAGAKRKQLIFKILPPETAA